MKLEQFAKEAGVTIVDCGPGWGGRVGYKMKDHPNSTYCGFRSAQSAYKHWLKGTFGEHTAKAVMKLLSS